MRTNVLRGGYSLTCHKEIIHSVFFRGEGRAFASCSHARFREQRGAGR